MRLSPLGTRRSSRRSSSCSLWDDHAVPAIRIPVGIMPVFFGAMCIYAFIVACTYPLLAGNGNKNRFERLVFPNEVVPRDGVVVDRNVREVGDQSSTSRPTRRPGKVDIVDREMTEGKQVSKSDIISQEDVIVQSIEKANVVPGNVKGNNTNAKLVNASLVNGDNKAKDDVGHRPVEPRAGVVNGVVGGGVDIINKQQQPDNNRQSQAEIEVKKKPPNKVIPVPKNERYIDEPVDAHTYPYIHRPDVCRNADGHPLKTQVIFMVTTAPGNFQRRQLIRETYGNTRNWPTSQAGAIRTVFLLGAVTNATLQGKIDAEFAAHGGDIVQEDFVDSFANLTLKTVMGLKWVTNNCRHATFTMKIDDDSMIHQNRLIKTLKGATTVNFTAGEALIGEPVLRSPTSKYYISKTYFPAHTFPPLLNSPGYLISTDLTEGLYRAATSIPFFPWEDVFIGLCLQRLGVVPDDGHDFILVVAHSSHIAKRTEAVRLFESFTVVSNLEPDSMRLMWDAFRVRSSKNAQ